VVRDLTDRATKTKLILMLSLAGLVRLGPSHPALAQTQDPSAIQVQSNSVVVPVIVFDRKRLDNLRQMDPYVYWQMVVAGDFRERESVAVRDLTAGDFSLFEDGQQRTIESFGTEPQGDSPIITDNLGQYRETTGIGGGTWAIPLWENSLPGRHAIEGPPIPGYVLGYPAQTSTDGSCHQVTVTVDRPNSLIFFRNGYCDARHSPADPLKGTKLGKQIQAELQATKDSEITISLAAIPLLTNAGTTRVRIVLDYSSTFVVGKCTKPKIVGIRRVMDRNDGTPAITFSDLGKRSYGHTFANGDAWMMLGEGFSGPCRLFAPIRYETQMEVPPGKYQLRVGLMDEGKFGKAQVPVSVGDYQGTQLEISGIVLAKRFRESNRQEPATELPGVITPLVAKGIQVTPSADTHFKKSEPFYFYFQVYEPQPSGAAELKVEAHLRIVDATTSKLMTELDPDVAYYRTPGSPLFPILGTIDVGALPTGSYQLQLRATDSAGNATPWRTASFTTGP